MSIALMTLAWKTQLPANQKMALLAMCDWANDEGGSLHPSISKIAERLSCSPRQAQRVVHGLIDDGWLFVVGNESGGAPGQSRQYRINVSRLTTGDTHVTGDTARRVTSMTQTGDIHDARRVTSMTQTGDTGDTLTVNRTVIRTVNKTTKGKAADEPVVIPLWLSAGLFDDFVEFRKSIRKPMNRRAQELAIQQLEKLKAEGHDPAEVINQSILNGWQGLFAVKATKPTPVRTGKHSGFQAMDYTQGINDDGSFV